eukprot:111842_1
MDSAFIFICLFTLNVINGQIVHVNKDATCSDSCDGSEQAPFPTIQAGLDASGSVLILNDGIYTGVGNVNLTLSFPNSYTTIKSQNGPLNTIIDCESGYSGIYLFGGQFTIEGLTMKNCHAINHDWLYNNVPFSGIWGGALFAYNTFTIINDCIFEGNKAERGAAIAIFSNTIFMTNLTIINNE